MRSTNERKSGAGFAAALATGMGLRAAGATPSFADESDAKFTDPSSGSYRLRPDSPLIDAGVLSDGMETATDLLGACRVVHGQVDIGCFEFPWRGFLFILR